jgi:aminoglycoside 3-N-acetyltransferase
MDLTSELATVMRIAAKRVVPRRIIAHYRDRHLNDRRTRNLATRPEPATADRVATPKSALLTDLRRLGVTPGRDLMVHSALSLVGPIDGGPGTLIDALREAVGDGTLLMPSYPFNGSMHNWMTSPAPFDVARTPSQMGALTEIFRNQPGAVRSGHPSHAVTALGPLAADYTRAHHDAGSPCGPGSPFAEHIARDGLILCLGTAIGKITHYHAVEDEGAPMPERVYLKTPLAKRVIFPGGREDDIATKVHDPALGSWRVDNYGPKETEFLRHMRDYDVIYSGRIGGAVSHLIEARPFHGMMRELLARGTTIYHRPALSLRSWR